jgi:MOSC domain-containing protein YiiM
MGQVVAVALDDAHRFSKQAAAEIELVAGLGVAGDAHAGETVKHRSRVARDPSEPNLRQVHLVHDELFDELAAAGFDAIAPGAIGENVRVRGIPLLDLPCGTRLALGEEAVIELTGLRNPCGQLNQFRPGLMQAVLGRTADGALVRKAGVMAVVLADGIVRPGDAVGIELPEGELQPLQPV